MALEDAKTQVDQAFTRETLTGPSFENTFGGATSFLRRRYTKDLAGADIAVTGIPFDQGVTNRPGTRLGPRAIREASALQAPDEPYGWPHAPLANLAIVDYGDMAFDYADVPAFPDRVTDHVRTILAAGAAHVARPDGAFLCDQHVEHARLVLLVGFQELLAEVLAHGRVERRDAAGVDVTEHFALAAQQVDELRRACVDGAAAALVGRYDHLGQPAHRLPLVLG